MATICLLNFSQPHRDNHALTLRACRLRVIVPEEQGKSFSDLQDEELRQVDYVLFDVTQSSPGLLRDLRRICRVQKNDGMPILVTCISRAYHGPELQLIVERIGGRIVYAE